MRDKTIHILKKICSKLERKISVEKTEIISSLAPKIITVEDKEKNSAIFR